jgi:hypothetical protein
MGVKNVSGKYGCRGCGHGVTVTRVESGTLMGGTLEQCRKGGKYACT